MKANHKYFILFISFFTILDQLTKLSIIRYFNIKSELLVDDFLFSVNEYLNFVIVWNKGFAFGLLQNDLFTINNLDRYDYNNITIYSRWGTIVYKTENYQNNWDGGKVAAGVYFYVLEVLEDNEIIIYQGTLTIIQ